jgi:hypothetical protein
MQEKRKGEKKHKKSVHGWGEFFNIKIPADEFPKLRELIKVKTQKDFEQKYKIEFGREVEWSTTSYRVAAILEWVEARKDKPCDTEPKLH